MGFEFEAAEKAARMHQTRDPYKLLMPSVRIHIIATSLSRMDSKATPQSSTG